MELSITDNAIKRFKANLSNNPDVQPKNPALSPPAAMAILMSWITHRTFQMTIRS